MHYPTDRIAHTTTFVTPVVEHWLEREIAQWVHPMKDRSDDPSHHERTLLPRSYISLPGNSLKSKHTFMHFFRFLRTFLSNDFLNELIVAAGADGLYTLAVLGVDQPPVVQRHFQQVKYYALRRILEIFHTERTN